ncbi:MAG: hypothetical protein HQK56_06525 [Deltaproteobacteria bacterium]|nr:hypothetical protein [Deltaproteobacteria bacterium]
MEHPLFIQAKALADKKRWSEARRVKKLRLFLNNELSGNRCLKRLTR